MMKVSQKTLKKTVNYIRKWKLTLETPSSMIHLLIL
jgi:hypothetical protein